MACSAWKRSKWQQFLVLLSPLQISQVNFPVSCYLHRKNHIFPVVCDVFWVHVNVFLCYSPLSLKAADTFFAFLFVCRIFVCIFPPSPLSIHSLVHLLSLLFAWADLSSQLDNEECSVTLTSISPGLTSWHCDTTFDPLLDSLINYLVLWFMSKCYAKIIDNRWSFKNVLCHIFFAWLLFFFPCQRLKMGIY